MFDLQSGALHRARETGIMLRPPRNGFAGRLICPPDRLDYSLRAASGPTLPERFVQFAFGGHVLEVEGGELRRGERVIGVDAQVLDLLVYLVEKRDGVVSKDGLIASVWGGRSISDAPLTSRI